MLFLLVLGAYYEYNIYRLYTNLFILKTIG